MADEKKVEEQVSNIRYVKQYFEAGKHGRKVELGELKKLSKEAREELGQLSKEAMEKGWS